MSNLLKLDPNFKPAFDGVALAHELINKILTKRQLVKAILFGSSAECKNTADSDLNILLIIPDGEEPENYYKIVNTPFFSKVAVDWIIFKESDFKKKKDVGGFCFVADKRGINLINFSNTTCY
jgi:predicted nucleotidyltransferase